MCAPFIIVFPFLFYKLTWIALKVKIFPSPAAGFIANLWLLIALQP